MVKSTRDVTIVHVYATRGPYSFISFLVMDTNVTTHHLQYKGAF